MTHITRDPIRKLPEAPQPPLSYPGATADSDRAKRPPLGQAWRWSGTAGNAMSAQIVKASIITRLINQKGMDAVITHRFVGK